MLFGQNNASQQPKAQSSAKFAAMRRARRAPGALGEEKMLKLVAIRIFETEVGTRRQHFGAK